MLRYAMVSFGIYSADGCHDYFIFFFHFIILIDWHPTTKVKIERKRERTKQRTNAISSTWEALLVYAAIFSRNEKKCYRYLLQVFQCRIIDADDHTARYRFVQGSSKNAHFNEMGSFEQAFYDCCSIWRNEPFLFGERFVFIEINWR